MRLGLLGPANGDLDGLASAARFLLAEAQVDRAIYLGKDDALDRVVEGWAESLVGNDPWRAAAELAATGDVAAIDAFVKSARARQRLRALEVLPGAGRARAMEMLVDKVVVFIHDKALLDEEDIFAASLLVYGKSDDALAKRIGPRWFLTPGKIGCARGGALVLEEKEDDVIATFYDAAGCEGSKEALGFSRASTAKLRVQGDS